MGHLFIRYVYLSLAIVLMLVTISFIVKFYRRPLVKKNKSILNYFNLWSLILENEKLNSKKTSRKFVFGGIALALTLIIGDLILEVRRY